MTLFIDEVDEVSQKSYLNAVLVRSIMICPVFEHDGVDEFPKELNVEIVPFDYTLYHGWWLGRYKLDGTMENYMRAFDAYNSAMRKLELDGHIRTGDFNCESWEVIKSIHAAGSEANFY